MNPPPTALSLPPPPFLRSLLRRGEENPVAWRVWRHQRRSAQLIMLAAVALFATFLTLLYKPYISTQNDLTGYYFLRWWLLDFLWLWMAADHLISMTVRWRRAGALDDWRLTALTPREIAFGLLRPAILFMLAGHSLHFVLEALIPFELTSGPPSPGNSPLFPLHGGVILFYLTAGLSLWASGAATIVSSSAWHLRAGLECSARNPHWAWLGGLISCGMALLAADLAGFFAFFAISSIIRNFLYEGYRDYSLSPFFFLVSFSSGALLSAWLKIWAIGHPCFRKAAERIAAGNPED